jgi:aerobic carbon-monoxide dehydrogenase medium subunit
MKPPAFDYAAPTEVAEVLDLLTARADDDPRVIAGGQSLVPLMNFRLAQPGVLIDLQHVRGLSDIHRTDDELVIGAMVRQSAAEESADVQAAAPLLVEALGHVAHLPIRNSGTVGGSIAHADPSAELPAAVLALDATLTAAGPGGERRIPAAEFFQGPFATALAPDEILTEVRIPHRPGAHAFVEFARTHGSFAVVAVAVDLAVDDGGTVTRAAVALSGVGPTAVRATAAEEALVGTVPDAESIASAVAAAVAGLSPAGDVHGSSETKVDAARSCLRRGIELALHRAANRR